MFDNHDVPFPTGYDLMDIEFVEGLKAAYYEARVLIAMVIRDNREALLDGGSCEVRLGKKPILWRYARLFLSKLKRDLTNDGYEVHTGNLPNEFLLTIKLVELR